MRGAAAVNEEFEVGFSQKFESHWYRAEQVGRLVMIAFTAAAALGLLGRGPFSHSTVRSSGGGISADYEPITRHGTTTMITLHIKNPNKSAQPIDLHIGQQMIEPMGFQRTVPLADSSIVSNDGTELRFLVVADQPEALVRFELMPSAVGIVPLHISDGHDVLDWSLLVVP